MESHRSALFSRIEMQILLNLTAEIFERPAKTVWIYPSRMALRKYAEFTVNCMNSKPADPEVLYAKSYRLGSRIRKITGFTGSRDIEHLVFWLYRNINIAMSGSLPGTVTVSGCYFSRYYTPRQCALMSYVDSGIVSGIAGRGELIFTQRITEGSDCCMAVLGPERTLSDNRDRR